MSQSVNTIYGEFRLRAAYSECCAASAPASQSPRTTEIAITILHSEGLTWTSLMNDKEDERGWDNPLAAHYGISGIPTAILVDRDGKVISMRARGQALNQLLEELLGPVEETEDKSAEKQEGET